VVVVWFAKRKKPRFYRDPQEAWLDLLALSDGGFAKVGFPERVQVYASEVDVGRFLKEFFPEEILEMAMKDYHSGRPEALLAVFRGLLLYATYRPRFERFLALTIGKMLAEGRSPVTSPSKVRDGETGQIIALGTFYGRYPVFVAHVHYSANLESEYRALGLRRIDSQTRTPFAGYIRWIPAEFGIEADGMEAEENRPTDWESIPMAKDLAEGMYSQARGTA
jgi:hypothetical protein